MILTQWMKHLRTLGIELYLEGDRLRFKAAKGALTPSLRTEIKNRKEDIVRFLRRVESASGNPMTTIPKQTWDGPGPLSFGQARLWFHDQWVPDTTVYAIPTAVRLEGPLHWEALVRTFKEIVGRHEVLRTHFPSPNGKPQQIVSPSANLPLTLIDLSSLTPSKRDEAGETLTGNEVGRPFRLEQGPLVRLHLLRFSSNDYRLLLMMHHIVADGWSMVILLGEFAHFYRAFATNQPPALPPLPIQFRDYSAWERQQPETRAYQDSLTYWSRNLANLPELALPLDRPRQQAQTFAGAFQSMQVDPEKAELLSAIGSGRNVTWFAISTAIFLTVLHHWTGSDDLVVGTDVANRERPETSGLIGFLVNQVALRFDLSGDPSFERLLDRVRRISAEAFSHAQVPFDLVAKAIQPSRSTNKTPLFQVKIVHQPPATPIKLPGLKLLPESLNHGTAKFDLLFNISQWGQQRSWTLEYNTDLFDGTTIQRLKGQLQAAVGAFSDNPRLGVEDFSRRLAKEAQFQRKERRLKLRGNRNFHQTVLKPVKVGTS